MEHFDKHWREVEKKMEERFGKVPDLEGILFLIGVNELGRMPERRKFTKEQKQDLMHIAVCKLLSQEGYYEFVALDEQGWPHYQELKAVPVSGLQGQELLLKECIIKYFT